MKNGKMIVLLLCCGLILSSAQAARVMLFEFDGDATDSSGNGYNATAVGSPAYVASVRPELGQAVSMNGANDYFRITNSTTLNFNDGVTIAAWIKAPLGISFQPILANGIGTDDGWGFQQYSTSDRMGFYTMGNDFQADPVNPFDNAWHHVAVTAADGLKTLYFDGAEVATRAYTGGLGTNPNAREFWIGNNPESTGRFWGGLIDDLVVYDNALSGTAISNIMNYGAVTVVPEPATFCLLGLGSLLFARKRRA